MSTLKAIAGTGLLQGAHGDVPVGYDLVEHKPDTPYSATGTVFGEADQIRDFYLTGPGRLRLEDGRLTDIVLLSCSQNGSAEVGILSHFEWR